MAAAAAAAAQVYAIQCIRNWTSMMTTAHFTVFSAKRNIGICVFALNRTRVLTHRSFDKKSDCPLHHHKNYNQIAIWNTGENIFVEYPFVFVGKWSEMRSTDIGRIVKIKKHCGCVDAKKTEAQTYVNASHFERQAIKKNKRKNNNGCKDSFFLLRWQTWLVWMCALVHESIQIAHLILIKRSFLSRYMWKVCRVHCCT